MFRSAHFTKPLQHIVIEKIENGAHILFTYGVQFTCFFQCHHTISMPSLQASFLRENVAWVIQGMFGNQVLIKEAKVGLPEEMTLTLILWGNDLNQLRRASRDTGSSELSDQRNDIVMKIEDHNSCPQSYLATDLC